MKKVIMLLGLFTFLLTVNASAQTKIIAKKRTIVQHKKIHHGVANGELNKRETKRLRKEQKNISKTIKRAKADGVVTKRERHIIDKKQDRAARHIRHQKKD